MTNQETPDQRRKRLAAARQARYVARQRAAGKAVGVTVRQDVLDAITPRVVRVIESGRALGPALTPDEIDTGRLGLKVKKILAAGGLKAAALKKLLDL